MFLVDSNLIVAHFRKSEKHHKTVKEFFKDINEFVITDHVLAETMTILKWKEGSEIAYKALELLLEVKEIFIVQMQPIEIQKTTQFFLEQNRGISFVDASLLVIAKNRDLSLATMDKELVKAGALLA
ncbi:MAG: PIN domain-containing protein [Patescibacteria group bacterium]